MTLNLNLPEGLLDAQDQAFLLANRLRMESDWHKRQIFRTETEARASVLNDLQHPTPDAKYWQAVREHALMLEQLIQLGFDWRRNQVVYKRAIRDMEMAGDELSREEAAITRDEAAFKSQALRQVAVDRLREIKMWQTLQDELLPYVLDSHQVNTHQAISYARRWLNAAANLSPAANPAEVENILGQAISFARLAQSQGQIEQVLDGLPDATRQLLQQCLPGGERGA